VLLIHTLSEKLLHKKVNLIDRVELCNILRVHLILDPVHVFELNLTHIAILKDILKCTLFPPIFYTPVELSLHLGLLLLFVGVTVAVVAVLTELTLITFELLPSGSALHPRLGLTDTEVALSDSR